MFRNKYLKAIARKGYISSFRYFYYNFRQRYGNKSINQLQEFEPLIDHQKLLKESPKRVSYTSQNKRKTSQPELLSNAVKV